MKDSMDKRETAWHVSTAFRERQPVALPLSNFLRWATRRRRGVAQTRQVAGMRAVAGTRAVGRDKGSSRDKGSGRDEEGNTDVGAARMRGTTEGGRMRAAAGTRRQYGQGRRQVTLTWGRHNEGDNRRSE